jgi:hypothetical protein
MRLFRLLASASVALLVAITPRLSSAYLPFPGYIQTHLKLMYTPPCTICHQTLLGGLPNTLVQPFGQAVFKAGVTPASTEAEFDAALDSLGNLDSDCNKIPDLMQLADGRDPNPPGEYIDGSSKSTPNDEPPGGCGPGLQPVLYGCGSQLSAALPSWGGAAALVAVLGVSLARRRRLRR